MLLLLRMLGQRLVFDCPDSLEDAGYYSNEHETELEGNGGAQRGHLCLFCPGDKPER